MLKLNGNDVVDFSIVYTKAAGESVRTAAKELQEYLQKLTGYTLPCGESRQTTRAILLGDACSNAQTRLAQIRKEDGFAIFDDGGDLAIVANTEAGVLYGAYRFLEKYLGVEWLTPDCEVFLKDLENADVRVDETYDFAARMRIAFSWMGYDEKYRARHRLTYTVGDTNDVPAYGNLRGLKFAFYWGYFGHTFELFIPYEEFFEEHPEWFSFAEGRYGENHRYQICLTNPEVLKIVTERALAYLDKYPDCKIISVSQNDAYADFEKNYCVCENCKKIFDEDGSYAAVNLQFVNKVAAEIKKKRPDVLVHTFAYHFTEEPPKTIAPADNVGVQFCVHLPYSAAFTDNTPVSLKEKKKVDRWAELTPNLFAWTYICNHGNYSAPIGNFRALYENTTYLLRLGVIGIFQQERMDFYNGEFCELRTYLTAKIFDNPQMTYEEYCYFARVFFDGYYGKGGKYIYEYLQLLDEHLLGKSVDGTEEYVLSLYGDETFVLAGEKLYEKAFALAENETQRARVSASRLQLDFCRCALEYKRGSKEYPTLRKKMVEKMLAQGIKCYRENCKIPDPTRLDYSKSPLVFAQKDKTLTLTGGRTSERVFAGDSTCPEYGFGYTFTSAYKDGILQLDIDVTDSDLYYTDNNMDNWEQDCLEIYVSESCNRSKTLTEGDYKLRINAHGAYTGFGKGDDKVAFCKVEQTEKGYCAHIGLYVDSQKIGLEIMAHDCAADGKYRSTRYWNALKFADVFSSPYHYGIIEIKE